MSTDTEDVSGSPGEPADSELEVETGSTARRFERPLTVAAGLALLVRGARRKSLLGLGMATAGGWLVYRGVKNRPLSRSISSASSGAGTEDAGGQSPVVERSVTVDSPAEDLHEYWRKPEQLSKIMGSFAQVTPSDDDQLHWRLEGPMGKTISWETRFVEDTPGEVLRWETVEGAPIGSEWTVRYQEAPGERGTEVTLRAELEPPGGTIGAAALNRFDFALASVVDTALHRFKSLAETGEVPTLEHNPSARGSGDLA